jgi:hypothetical protein
MFAGGKEYATAGHGGIVYGGIPAFSYVVPARLSRLPKCLTPTVHAADCSLSSERSDVMLSQRRWTSQGDWFSSGHVGLSFPTPGCLCGSVFFLHDANRRCFGLVGASDGASVHVDRVTRSPAAGYRPSMRNCILIPLNIIGNEFPCTG